MGRHDRALRSKAAERSKSANAGEWSLRVVLRQVVRTLLAQPAMALLLVALIAAVSGGLTFVEATMRQNAIDYQQRLTAAGQYVYRAQARTESGEGLISAAACAALNGATGVKAAVGFAGGASAYVAVTLAKAPGEHLTLRTASGNPVPVLDPSSPSRFDDGVFIDATLAKRLGIWDGMRVELGLQRYADSGAIISGSVGTGGAGGTGSATVATQTTMHVIDMSARGFNESQNLYAIGPAIGTVAECLVEFDPGAWGESARQTLDAALGDGHTVISVAPFLRSDATAITPLQQFETRASRLFWLVSGLACFALLAMPLVFRRHEFALYRSVGAGSNPTALIYAFANALLLAAGHVAGWLWMMLAFQWTRHASPASPGMLAMTAGASLLVATAATTAACMALSRGSMARFIQQRL